MRSFQFQIILKISITMLGHILYKKRPSQMMASFDMINMFINLLWVLGIA